MWNISGASHDAYNDFRSNIDSYTVDSSAYGDGIVETIDPNLIEGISLSSREVNDPGLFWGQHKSDGTMDSFIEVASHIPEVKARLDSGVPLSELQSDPALGDCASIYFNPESATAPTLVKGDGFYEFQSNGRHRIIAARILGHSFPVRVIGQIRLK